MNTHVLVFDMDDTLYPERDYVHSGLRAAGALAERELGVANLATEAIALFESGRRGDLFQQALRRLGRQVDETTIGALVAAYRNHRPTLHFFPDVEEVLRQFRRSGATLAVITDGHLPPQKLKADALRLPMLFNPVVFTEELGREHWKPSQRAFALIEQVCRAVPSKCVYVADNPRKDFMAPRARGWTTVRVRRPATEHAHVEALPGYEADLEVSDFTGLRRAL
jgi:putative hydrolase of the HAD superfamily